MGVVVVVVLSLVAVVAPLMLMVVVAGSTGSRGVIVDGAYSTLRLWNKAYPGVYEVR